MVWGLFPVDAVPGEDKYYIFSKGAFRVGRKGCEIVVNKDKGVSRVHAEIIVDAMTSMSLSEVKTSNLASKVRIRDCSKYGTVINKNLESPEKVHEESTLKDGDSVTLVLVIQPTESSQAKRALQDKVSSIGASIISQMNQDCTHVLVDQVVEVTEGLLDAVLEKKPLVHFSWLESLAEQHIRNEIPSCSNHIPTLAVRGVSIKVADSKTRDTCLQGYTFILEPIYMYKFGDKLQMLLGIGGGKILSMDEFCSTSQGSFLGDNQAVYVVPGQSSGNRLSKLALYRMDEEDLILAVLCGQLTPSSLRAPPVLVSSSCSTDETVVADSDVEEEISKPIYDTVNIAEDDTPKPDHDAAIIVEDTPNPVHDVAVTHAEESITSDTKENVVLNIAATRSENGYCMPEKADLKYTDVSIAKRKDKIDASEEGISDVIYSQDIIVRAAKLPARTEDTTEVNFKRFRKRHTQSGNSFDNLVPFSKFPYKDSEYGGEEVTESLREEKKRKQLEALAEDLFNNDKGRKRGVAGSLRGFLTRS